MRHPQAVARRSYGCDSGSFQGATFSSISMPGTATAVWWERLIDPEIVFGIPQVGMLTPEGAYLENTQLEPDIRVAIPPEDVAAGNDRQLESAVKELLEQIRAD